MEKLSIHISQKVKMKLWKAIDVHLIHKWLNYARQWTQLTSNHNKIGQKDPKSGFLRTLSKA